MDLELRRNWYSVEVLDYPVAIRIDAFERKGRTPHEGIDIDGLEAT
jgi:hypothetical protein